MKKDDILSAIKAYMSQINLQHKNSGEQEDNKVKRLQNKNGYAQKYW